MKGIRKWLFPVPALVAALTLLSTADTGHEQASVDRSPAGRNAVRSASAHEPGYGTDPRLAAVAVDTRPAAGAQSRSRPQTAAGLAMADFARQSDRVAQIAALDTQPPSNAYETVRPLLHDPDPLVRLAALESIADLEHEARIGALLAAIDDPNMKIRLEALQALTRHGDASATARIANCLFDPEDAVRMAAIDALAALEDESAVSMLAAMLGDPDPDIRARTLAALGEIGGLQAISFVRQMRHDPVASVRASAIAILVENKGGAGNRM